MWLIFVQLWDFLGMSPPAFDIQRLKSSPLFFTKCLGLFWTLYRNVSFDTGFQLYLDLDFDWDNEICEYALYFWLLHTKSS